jgi:hypothetical protein
VKGPGGGSGCGWGAIAESTWAGGQKSNGAHDDEHDMRGLEGGLEGMLVSVPIGCGTLAAAAEVTRQN